MNRDQVYLVDIVQFGKTILEYVEGMSKEDFKTDRKTQDAVLYEISILGEAVKKLSAEFRQRHPSIPWKRIAGMRDKLIHDYRRVNTDMVWQVVQTNINELINYLEPLLINDKENF